MLCLRACLLGECSLFFRDIFFLSSSLRSHGRGMIDSNATNVTLYACCPPPPPLYEAAHALASSDAYT